MSIPAPTLRASCQQTATVLQSAVYSDISPSSSESGLTYSLSLLPSLSLSMKSSALRLMLLPALGVAAFLGVVAFLVPAAFLGVEAFLGAAAFL
jgi:hypothetical protein